MLGVSGWGSGAMAKSIAPPTGMQFNSFGVPPQYQPTTGPTPNTVPTQGQQAIDYFSGIYGPDLALNQQQSGNLAGQLGTTQAGYDLAVGAAQQGAAADLAKVNLGPQYDAIERAGNLRQMGVLDQQGNLAYRMLGSQFQGFDLQKLQSWQDAAKHQHAAMSDATARGAVTGRGIKRTFGDIQHDLANQLTGIDINKYQATNQAQSQQLTRNEQKAQLEDRNKTLDIKAKEYGIDRSKIQANLEQGLARLGIENSVTVNQILDALNSNDVQRMGIAHQIFNDAMTYSDFFMTTNPAGGSSGTAPTPNPVRDQAVDDYMSRVAAP